MVMIKIRNGVVYGLHKHLGITPVPQDQVPKKPSYPYMTYKFITPYIPPRGTGNLTINLEPSKDSRFDKDVVERLVQQPTMTLSIDAYSKGTNDDHASAYNLMKEARDWFRHSGHLYLDSKNIVVVRVEAVGDRTAQIIDDYEVRYGFDVTLRFTEEMVLRYETIERYGYGLDIKDD